MGTWQQEIVLRSSNCSFKLICETVSGGGGLEFIFLSLYQESFITYLSLFLKLQLG